MDLSRLRPRTPSTGQVVGRDWRRGGKSCGSCARGGTQLPFAYPPNTRMRLTLNAWSAMIWNTRGRSSRTDDRVGPTTSHPR